MLRRSAFASLVTLSLAICLPLAGHDFYLLPSAFHFAPGDSIRIAFNNGDSFPESEAAPSLARLKDARLLSLRDTLGVQTLKMDGKRVIGLVKTPQREGTFVIAARTAPNFIELPADKFLDYLKEQGLTQVIDWRSQHGESSRPGKERYSKYAKSLIVSGTTDSFYRYPVGFPIEIIPTRDPATLHAGDRLPVQVLWNGKPLTGLQVEAAWTAHGKSKTTVIGRTDSTGHIDIPLAAAGRWRLHSLHMERCSEPAAADWESSWASLTFEVR